MVKSAGVRVFCELTRKRERAENGDDREDLDREAGWRDHMRVLVINGCGRS